MDADRAVEVAKVKDQEDAARRAVITAIMKAQSQKGKNVGFDPMGLWSADPKGVSGLVRG